MRALILALFALLLLANTTTDTAERLMEEGKEAEAFAMIESAASQGDAESVNFLAWFYDNGRYVA
ncbi:MAG: hypothetical protein WAT93_05145, partial [Pontixanthobacter sp.]